MRNQLPTKSLYQPRKLMHEINVTPFVDVLLVLLVIFIATAPLLYVQVPINLPETQASDSQDELERQIVISITESGSIHVNDDLVELDRLSEVLSAFASDATDNTVELRGDRLINYGTVAKVLGILNRVGFNKIALPAVSEN